MGWLFYHRPPGQSVRDHFAAKFGDRYEIVECATVRNVFYAAVRSLADGPHDKAGEVWGFIALIRRQRGEFNFGYKDMAEWMGCIAEAPARVLDALTPTDNDIALQWRQECRLRLADAAERRERRRGVHRGSIISVSRDLNFGDHGTASLFEYQPEGRKAIWWALDANHARRFRCRLGGDWATRLDWKLVAS